ncbi:hypothetical protein EAO69_40615 [Streptomyces sp. me109]|nr:hypothetical protein EAO69_40615 [Streptomyces sp. me109]
MPLRENDFGGVTSRRDALSASRVEDSLPWRGSRSVHFRRLPGGRPAVAMGDLGGGTPPAPRRAARAGV